MAAPNPRLADLPDAERQALESWLVAFDQDWDEGLLASRVPQLAPGSSWRVPALAEMVKIDLERQWQRGRQISLESYLAQFPELGRPEDVSADLIWAEYEVRRQFGAAADREEYLRRFPHRAAELARLIDQSPASSMGRQPRSPAPPLPQQLGRYSILRRLGQGGMGSVYLAEDTQLQRQVALKVPDLGPGDDPELRRRFLIEALTAATLDHPALCKVYDAGEIDGRLYLTMAYIEGQPLSALAGAEGWPEEQAAALVVKLALAMAEAHAKQVIHRDLKPANVMIRTSGEGHEPVIVDFGLARGDHGEADRLTGSGQVMGTLAYMAPEQVRGDQEAVGPACDIYALGVILYELLTGRRPFTGAPLAVAALILTEAPAPPSAHRSGLDRRLEAICLKAMAPEIGDRHSSMSELAAALAGFLRSLAAPPEPAARQPPWPVQPWARVRRAVAAAVLGVVVLGLAIAVVNVGGKKLPGEAPARPPPVRLIPPSRGREKPQADAPRPGIAAESRTAPAPKAITSTLGLKLVLIPAGEFLMGAPESEPGINPREGPQHRVRITRPFYLGATEVTVGQFGRFIDKTGYRTQAETDGKGGKRWNEAHREFEQDPQYNWHNPGFDQTDDDPVVNVTWGDAIAFCAELSIADGLRPFDHLGARGPWDGEGYRLPTEAEWEYACRAGSTTAFSFGDDPARLGEFAWYDANSGFQTHPAAAKPANRWGLHDMHGNVWEWCWDWFDPDYYQTSAAADPLGPPQGEIRVFRGGGWDNVPIHVRSAVRGRGAPRTQNSPVGFRVVRVALEEPRPQDDLVDRLQPGTVWIGERTYRAGAYAVKTVTYELHVENRAGRRFWGYKFDNGPRRNRVEVEGLLDGTDIIWTESDWNAVMSVQGTLVENRIDLTFHCIFSSGATTRGDGKLSCQ
jgi:formylglycine-generating enzyme required for sulfatase activity